MKRDTRIAVYITVNGAGGQVLVSIHSISERDSVACQGKRNARFVGGGRPWLRM